LEWIFCFANLKVHKNENFFGSDFEFCTISRSCVPLSRRIVLRIRIHMFLGLLDPDPDPLVRVMGPDPSINKQNL
jgi:hypothetical protein